MKLKLAAIIVLVAVGAGALVMAIHGPFGGQSAASQYLTAAASRRDVTAQAVANGTIGAAATYGLAFGQPAQLMVSATQSGGGGNASTFIVDKVSAQVGGSVKAGQVLASADTSTLNVQLQIAQAQLASAKARLVADEGGPTALIVASARDAITAAQLAYSSAVQAQKDAGGSNTLTLAQAQQAVTNAQNQLATDQAGPSQDTIVAAQDPVNQAQQALTDAQQNLANVQAQDALSIQSAQTALANAQAKLQSDLNPPAPAPSPSASPAPAPTPNAATIAADQAAVTAAQQNLQSVQLKATQAEQQAQNQIDSAQLSLTAAQHGYTLKVTPSATAIAADQQALATAQNNLTAAQLKVSTADHTSATQIAQAQAALTSAQHGYATRVAPATPDVIAADQASLASAQSSVTNAKDAVARGSLIAPADGTVVTVNLEPGAAAPPGYAIVVQSNNLQVVADFAESDLPSLALGQTATVTVNATGDSISGAVASISPSPATSGSSSVVTYAVVVSLTNPPAGVRAGMTASVAITTAQATNVVAVPTVAIQSGTDGYAVSVLGTNGTVQQVPVQVGLVTSSYAEIQSGLSEGQTVITGVATQRQSTTTSGGFGVPGLGGGFRPNGGSNRSGTGTGGGGGGD